MIEKGLNQHNFMPGTERYTRPEEVKALNKFLKSIKETQEEHTEISEDNLVLPNDKTGPNIPKVDLDSRRVDVNGVLSQVDRLVEGRLNIQNNNPEHLEDSKVNLGYEDKVSSLSEVKEKISQGEDKDLDYSRIDISEGKQVDLETEKLELSGNQVNSLGNSKLEITNTKEPSLPGNPEDLPMTGEGLQEGKVSGLSSDRETIEENKNIDLENSKVEIKDENKVFLENKELKISDNHKNSLESEVLKIKENQTKSLEDSKEKIKDTHKNSLETGKLEISDTHKNSLEDTLEKITPGKDQNLETDKLKIQSNQEKDLETEVLEIQRNDEVDSLGTTKLEISGNEPETLEDEVLGIQENQVSSLSDTKETIQSNQDKELETTKLNLQENKVNSLEDNLDTIESNEDHELSEEKLEIQENQVTSLENNLETITPGEQKNLETTRLDLQETKVNSLVTEKLEIQENNISSLSDTKETIQSNQDKELETTKLNLQENKVNSLEDNLDTIESNEDHELSEEKLEIQENSVESLVDSKENIYPENDRDLETEVSDLPVDSKVDSLGDTVIEGPSQSNPESLEDEIVGLGVDSEISSLSDTRIDINPAQDNTLSESREDLSVEEKISDLENSLEGLGVDEKVDSLSEVIIEGPETNEKDLDISVIDLDKGEEKVDSLETMIITGPASNNPESLEDAIISLTKPEDQELETTREELKTSEDQNSLEDFIDTLDSLEDINLDETQVTLDSSSNYSGVLEDSRIEGPGNSDLSGRTYSDGSYSLSDVELKDTKIGLKDNRRPLEDLEDEKLIISGVENYEEGQGNSNFYDKLPEDKISGIQDPGLNGRTISDSTKYKLSDVELKYDSIELDYEEDNELISDSKLLSEDQGYSLGNRTIQDLDDQVVDPEYAITYVEEVSRRGDKPDIKTPSGYTTENRTIIDLNDRVKDPDYAISEIENVSKRGDKADIDVPVNAESKNRTTNNSKYSAIEIKEKDDLTGYQGKSKVESPGNDSKNRTYLDPKDEYGDLPEGINSRKDLTPTIKTPENQTSKEIDSLEEIGELKVSDKYGHRNGKTGDHGYLTPGYKLPEIGWKNFWDGGALSPSTYLRWATENTVGKIPLKGAMKGKLIDETLALLVIAREKLEKVTKANRERLPGGDMGLLSSLANGSLSVKSAAKSVLGAVGKALSTSTVDKSQPINRPTKDKETGKYLQKSWEAPGQEVLDSTVSTSKGGGGFFKKLGKALTGGSLGSDGGQRDFSTMVNSLGSLSDLSGVVGSGIGIGRTLNDLVNSSSGLNSLEDFKSAIKTSRYITSPNKFTSTADSTNYMTLDSNHVWEVILQPYFGKSNGNKTWLPSFYEIDKQNKKAFNVTTHYSSGWLPITGFELQEKKLTSKELPLFNGSFSFPIGLEFTNELRLTFADDSLKSLKRYFDLCTKVSAYMSNIHNIFDKKDYYEPQDNLDKKIEHPTVYLEGKIHPGLYKNLSFLITIFILTPQFGTIKKCNLLCVIKDYTIENQGETDSSPTELNVTFSIVGENPSESITSTIKREYKPTERKYKINEKDSLMNGILNNLGSVVNIF